MVAADERASAMPNPEAHNTPASSESEPGSPRSRPPGVTSGERPIKPLLASDALREDLAPIEPGKAGARYWGVILGALLCAMTALGSFELWTGWVPQLAVGAMALLAGALPVPYALRASALLLAATAAAILGVSGLGPMAGIARPLGEWGLLHFLAGAGLPAALMFRARYRAFPGARSILFAALLFALPFAAWCALRIASGPLVLQITSGAALLALVAGTVGFMGPETTVAGEWIGAVVIAAVVAQLSAELLTAHGTLVADAGLLGPLATAVAFLACAILGSVGMFQLLARRHWAEARTIDVHRAQKASRPPMPSGSDPWSTRQ